jgi:glycosyltransferase involved in cell wall biosynthesis
MPSTTSDPRLHVVYLDHTGAPSGAELALVRLLPGLPDIDAHAILAETGPLTEYLDRAGAVVEVLELAPGARRLNRSRVGAKVPIGAVVATAGYVVRLARRLRSLDADIVHANSLKAGVYGGLAARLARVPFVWQVHDRLAPDYMPAAATRMIRSMLATLPDAVIANSETTRATLGALRRPLVRTIGNAVPASLLDDAGPVVEHDPLRVGLIGRIATWKGQDVFLEAFARAFGDGTTRAVIVGAPLFGQDDVQRSLHQLAHQLGIEDRVEFRGFRDDVGAELARLDIVVHASTIPEPFGQVIVEGMAAGLPVVAAIPGGPAEIVDDGVTGLLYPAGDTVALAHALRTLADDRDLRGRLGRAARQRAQDFSAARIGAAVQEVYATVLDRRGRRPRRRRRGP